MFVCLNCDLNFMIQDTRNVFAKCKNHIMIFALELMLPFTLSHITKAVKYSQAPSNIRRTQTHTHAHTHIHTHARARTHTHTVRTYTRPLSPTLTQSHTLSTQARAHRHVHTSAHTQTFTQTFIQCTSS